MENQFVKTSIGKKVAGIISTLLLFIIVLALPLIPGLIDLLLQARLGGDLKVGGFGDELISIWLYVITPLLAVAILPVIYFILRRTWSKRLAQWTTILAMVIFALYIALIFIQPRFA